MPIRSLPHLHNTLFLTDGGLETTLVFEHGVALPHFAAFDLLRSAAGRTLLRDYYSSYAALANRHAVGFVLESPTWRTSADWGDRLGYSREELATANREAIGLMHEIRERFETSESPFVISGCVGPRGDGYAGESRMSAADAADYHAPQIRTLRDAGAELISALTIPSVAEAIGIGNAAAAADIPSVISFTVERDGRLPSGATLGEAITAIDAAATVPPAYYAINCAHPSHFESELTIGKIPVRRIRGIRANASRCSHAELDASPTLDAGEPAALGADYRRLRDRHPELTILGGCCGTNERHLAAICTACLPLPAANF
ncbi:MAG: homocysteine S-methyltransferase family protein [Chthoniobacterales bacterium]